MNSKIPRNSILQDCCSAFLLISLGIFGMHPFHWSDNIRAFFF